MNGGLVKPRYKSRSHRHDDDPAGLQWSSCKQCGALRAGDGLYCSTCESYILLKSGLETRLFYSLPGMSIGQ